MAWLVLGACVLLALLIAGPSLANADPRKLARAFRAVGIVAAGAVGLFLLLRGLTPPAIFLLGFAGYQFARALGWAGPGRMGGGPRRGPASGNRTRVRSRFLDMELDQDSGELSGRILAGPHAGTLLDDLDRETLVTLWQEWVQADDESARLLESYLDRVHGADWRDSGQDGGQSDSRSGQGRSQSGAAGGTMTRAEALSILGLTDGADASAIRSAHRQLMKQAHPDQGGSAWYAAKLNQARDLLLGD